MKVAIVLFDGITALDAIGPYEVLCRLPDTSVVFAASVPGLKRTDQGLGLCADVALDDIASPEVVLVPGGRVDEAMHDDVLRDWLRTADRTSSWTTSVCTGSLLLAGAGLLDGRRATTHWLELDELARLGAVAVRERVVVDGRYVTCAGVSAGLDMALALAGRLRGDVIAQAVQLILEYDPAPPYAAGSPDTAPQQVVDLVRSLVPPKD
ncbi:MAG: DJ-1/PfpI family protein [Mycobacteriales bacterium]